MFFDQKLVHVFLIVTFGQILHGLADGVSESPQIPTEFDKNVTSHTNILTPTTTAPELPLPPETCDDTTSNGKYNERDSKVCLKCDFNCSCVYGQLVNVTCWYKEQCLQKHPTLQPENITDEMICRYCYQTAEWEHSCPGTENCKAVSSPRERYISNCTVNADVLCLGNRTFLKKLPCNWTSGYRWSIAMLLSITLGGFGADRFYLGHWQEGIGKLFSFGGLGVWTIMDVILIAIRYLGPADGSLYI
ncbi:unnamed protein product [Meganyctiphanes norvegica]|uniref:TM2 domain-containing protein n=1 Tax=Meganyctiphanes norvegica TaxID=48144 RepID=A0AAV2RAS4_MEGNR